MIFLDELKDLKIYRKQFILPMEDKNMKNGSVIFLLTPNRLSSLNMMAYPLAVNKNKAFQSYYMEKNVNLIINSGKVSNVKKEAYEEPEYYADYIEESSLTASQRNDIPNNEFGLPRKRKYPLHDEQHVRSAIKFFNYVDDKDEKELARNIKKAIERFDITDINIGKDNRLSKYISESELEYQDDIEEAMLGYNTKKITASYLSKHAKYLSKRGATGAKRITNTVNKNLTVPGPTINQPTTAQASKDNKSEDTPVSEVYLSNIPENCYIQFGDDIILTEDAKNDSLLKQIFYAERIRQDKELIEIYNIIKETNPTIKFAYTKLDRYKGRNLYYDLSWYNQFFFKNNKHIALKGLNLYTDLIDRLINANSLSSFGYTKKTVFIPINDWESNPDTKMWRYKDGYNPISIIYQGLITNPARIVNMFNGCEVIFLDNHQRYFKVNFSNIKDYKKFAMKFKSIIDRLQNNEDVDDEDKDNEPSATDSKKVMVNNIIDKIEQSQNIQIRKLVGDTDSTNDKDLKDKIDSDKTVTTKDDKSTDKKSSKILSQKDTDDAIKSQEAKELVDAINKAVSKSTSEEDALDKLEDDRIKEIIMNLAAQEENNTKISAARASRMIQLQNDAMNKKINGRTLKDMINSKDDKDTEPLPKTSLTKVSGINKEQWENLHYVNFNRDYDVNEDIVKIINKLSKVSYPLAIRNIDMKDNSTSEDVLDLYTIEFEDFRGKRYTVRFDVPKFLPDGKYLMLRGNQKTIQNQMQNMPIIKTDNDTCQIISNYNKIFIRRFGNSAGKSNIFASKVLKAINKYNGKDIKIKYADCSRVSDKYELPIDYIDIGTIVSKIETKNYIFYFDQDEIRKQNYNINFKEGIPYGYAKNDNRVLYISSSIGIFAKHFAFLMSLENPEFKELYESASPTIRSTYSKCSILNTEIPLVVICAYAEGLENTLKKANIAYEIKEKIDKDTKGNDSLDWIRFKDGYVVYDLNYASSMLMNGLKECDTMSYSLEDINSKIMYTDFLDNFGGRLKADGLDNFYDCMIDPITEKVLVKYGYPTDYVSILVYANALLADNKFIKHTDVATKRLRKKELIAVKVYKTLFNDAYVSYANQIRHSRTVAQFTVKQSAVIDKFLTDQTSSDNSIINAINDVETCNEVTSKGESGMNADRAYSLDKRTYDDSMINVLAMSTGFAGNVGITRQGTIDMNVESERGYINTVGNDPEKMSTAKTLCITEALSPFGTTCDDPFRTAMNFIQTAKHTMRAVNSDPLLVTNGSDEALAYLTSDTFSFKAKKNGTIKEFKEGKYIIVQYDDGTKDYINLTKTTQKNSDGGFYIPMQLFPIKGLKEGQKVKANDIITYDDSSFSNNLGENDNLAYNVGTLAKIAVVNTDEGFEDSALVTETMCEKMATKVTVKNDRVLPKDTNIFNLVKIGQHVEEGDTLLVYQTPYDEEDMNILLKNLVNDAEEISELGRIPIKSHVTGTVSDIKLYRTVELEELSDSLRKAFEDYERPIKALKNKLDKEKILSSTLPASYKLPATGKLKRAVDGVLIEIYVEVYDIMAVGDKLVYDRANKGILKDIIPADQAPYTEFRPNEEISGFANVSSFNNRMVSSPLKIGALNKLLIELDRSCKDILGIEYDDSKV